jgi:Fe-S cluster assembly iron-binding protein IscA
VGSAPAIAVTSAAVAAAERDLATGERLRIAFAGGCGAMGFRIGPSRRSVDGDVEVAGGGLLLLLDRRSAAELDGATLDYDDDEGFRLDHPQWGLSC